MFETTVHRDKNSQPCFFLLPPPEIVKAMSPSTLLVTSEITRVVVGFAAHEDVYYNY